MTLELIETRYGEQIYFVDEPPPPYYLQPGWYVAGDKSPIDYGPYPDKNFAREVARELSYERLE